MDWRAEETPLLLLLLSVEVSAASPEGEEKWEERGGGRKEKERREGEGRREKGEREEGGRKDGERKRKGEGIGRGRRKEGGESKERGRGSKGQKWEVEERERKHEFTFYNMTTEHVYILTHTLTITLGSCRQERLRLERHTRTCDTHSLFEVSYCLTAGLSRFSPNWSAML